MSQIPRHAVRFLVIGCGSIGSRRARLLKAIGHNVAVADVDADRCGKLARELMIEPGYVGLDIAMNMLRDLDAAFICTPPNTHLDLAQQCADAGLHLFIEKPLSDRLDVGRLTCLVQTMQAKGLIGIMGQSYRFLPSLIDFRWHFTNYPLINGAILSGQHLGDWHPGTKGQDTPYFKDGIVAASLAHSLDQAQWLFGEVEALTALVCPQDTATVLLRMKKGGQVVIQNDYWKRPRQSRIEATCARAESDATTLFEWEYDAVRDERMYERETAHFVRCVEEDLQGQPDFAQGILNLELMDLATQASQTGTWQKVQNVWKQMTGRK